MAKFFMAATNLQGGRAFIRGRDAEHIKVLRMRPGEEIVISDGEGTDYVCQLVRVDNGESEVEILSTRPSVTEPTVRVTVLAGLPKASARTSSCRSARSSARRRSCFSTARAASPK